MNRPLIALIAHDARKSALVDWFGRHLDVLAPHPLVATGTTGGRLLERYPQLDLIRVKSGPLGGDQQIGALIAEARLQALIFFADPLTAMPHDVDVKALSRLALVYDLPMACNISTADALVRSGLFDAR